jgi:hypothetical protein
MRQRYLVAVIGIAAGLFVAAQSRSEVGRPSSAAEEHSVGDGCQTLNASTPKIVGKAVSSGIWKGFTVFKVPCGRDAGELFYRKRGNTLRYVVVRASQQGNGAASMPISVRSNMLRVLLEGLFESGGRRPAYSFATSAFPEIGARLAAAAAESSDWDRKSGHARAGDTNEFAKRLMNRKETYTELAGVFSAVGYSVRVSGVEDIFVVPVDRMTVSDKTLIGGHFAPSDKLPVSAAVYFRVEKR